MLASAITEILEGEPGFCVFAVARTGAEAVRLATQEAVGVVLMDYRLPDMTGAAAAGGIRTARPETPIVFHTADDSETALLDAIDAGASACQRRVAFEQGAREKLLAEFTPRELEILRVLAEGLDTPTIAGRLGIAPHTVEWHLRHVIEKLQVHSNLQALVAAVP